MRIAKLLKYWLPPLIWAGVIFAFSTVPKVETFEIYWQDFIVKKSAHMIEYGILAILLFRALRTHKVKRVYLWPIIIVFLYGLSDEFHQSLVPGREPRLRDVLFDTIGGGLAIYIVWKLLPKAPEKLRQWAVKLDLL